MEFAQTVGQSKCKFQINLIHKATCLPQAILKVMKSNSTFPHDCHTGDIFQPGLSILFGLKNSLWVQYRKQGVGYMGISGLIIHVLQEEDGKFNYLGALHRKCKN